MQIQEYMETTGAARGALFRQWQMANGQTPEDMKPTREEIEEQNQSVLRGWIVEQNG